MNGELADCASVDVICLVGVFRDSGTQMSLGSTASMEKICRAVSIAAVKTGVLATKGYLSMEGRHR